MDEFDDPPWLPAERIADPPSVRVYRARRRALRSVAAGFGFPIAAVALLFAGAWLLRAPSMPPLVAWLGAALGALIGLLAAVELVLAWRLVRFMRSEVGAYDYAWIDQARQEQPVVAEMGRQCLLHTGYVTVAELVRLWRAYVRAQRRSFDRRRREARRRCADALGLPPEHASATRSGAGDTGGDSTSAQPRA